MNPLQQYPDHDNILTQLFQQFNDEDELNILDAGSGRTSLFFLTKKFTRSHITAVIYPGDDRKKMGIAKDVSANNFDLVEADIQSFLPNRKYNIVLAHLLLGEATKFNSNSFENVFDSLINIKTEYLIIVDILSDPQVNFDLVVEKLKLVGIIQKKAIVDKYVGFLVKINDKNERQ